MKLLTFSVSQKKSSLHSSVRSFQKQKSSPEIYVVLGTLFIPPSPSENTLHSTLPSEEVIKGVTVQWILCTGIIT